MLDDAVAACEGGALGASSLTRSLLDHVRRSDPELLERISCTGLLSDTMATNLGASCEDFVAEHAPPAA